METTAIKVNGMSCGGCVASVTKVLNELPGVARAEVKLAPGEAVVEFDPARVTRAAMIQAIEDVGFGAG